MLITASSLLALYTGFQTSFQNGFGSVKSQWDMVAMETPSTTSEENYGWMKDIPGFREWIGPRVVHNLETASYLIRNKDWELTIGVDRNNIEDDKFGLYAPMFTEMGRQTANFPNTLVFPLLKSGFAKPCYDGQYFFDTDHPVIAEDGSTVSVSNYQAGAGTPWFLMDLSRAIKPIVYQKRRSFDFVRMDAPTGEIVFDRKQYRYGVDGRANVGFGFWQLAHGSKADLTHANYEAARTAMQNLKRDHGEPLGVNPTHLVVPPSLEGKGRQILENQRKANGEDNEWKGTAQLVVVPWLA
ncbi:MAG TPA: Mu-like prophage major head subunit gpT family protein [Azospirillum sp.]|nr:Mu-like prophage major head subunit gpT family protein [Azospirillum sp.]